jgi:hypothetical protein
MASCSITCLPGGPDHAVVPDRCVGHPRCSNEGGHGLAAGVDGQGVYALAGEPVEVQAPIPAAGTPRTLVSGSLVLMVMVANAFC